ncbi:DUF4395 domain-containing protein [Pseudolysinimonas yzui]|uniref:DUF4395 domain-containing protein n=1 Tax=Pseudolysinimonas yzui TaxID=2708254 RepID=A0A8J3GPK5_9MICO|nr:DUF4395 domain-containing protein [Pseudolysinimonas yzui]GHF11347.1 hypothetical protein GCM10011600_10720 [Pseudolysinimonas yzui]
MTAPSTPRGIDPRGPRFTAGVTAILFLVVIALALLGFDTAALVLAIYNAAVFLWSAVAGVARHPYGLFFKAVIRPRLKPPLELEDPTPPTFAQGVGLFVTVIGIVLFVPFGSIALIVAGAAAFLAAFLNSVFAYCLGCQIYLLLARVGVLGRKGAATA